MIHLYYTMAQPHEGRAFACRMLGCHEDDICTAPGGKPYLPGGPHFSISHSGGMVLLAVCADSPVGCDVEPTSRSAKNEAAILRKILPVGAVASDRPFLYHWTAYEARLKSGLGEAAEIIYPAVHDDYICAVACLGGDECADPIRY